MAPAARRFDYVLLDCDGTLLDTLSDLAAAGNHVCALHGWEPYSLEEYKRKVGNGQRVLASRIVPPELAGAGRRGLPGVLRLLRAPEGRPHRALSRHGRGLGAHAGGGGGARRAHQQGPGGG